MKNSLIMICTLMMVCNNACTKEVEVQDLDSGKPREILSAAAALAIERSNIGLLNELQKAGWNSNAPLIDARKSRWWHQDYPLAFAVSVGSEEGVKWLLRNGAVKHKRGQYGTLPIYNIRKSKDPKEVAMCKLLALKLENSEDGLFDELARTIKRKAGDKNKVLFIDLNQGQKVPPKMDKAMKVLSPKVYSIHSAEVGHWFVNGVTSDYRHKKTKQLGIVVDISWHKIKVGEYKFEFTTKSSETWGGGGMKGRIKQYYGYWIAEDVIAWDS